jgi:hypothetical protein
VTPPATASVFAPGRRRRTWLIAGVFLLPLLLLGATALWQRAAQPVAPSDGAVLAAAALAEVCTTPTRLPRRSPVVAQPQRDPFMPAGLRTTR